MDKDELKLLLEIKEDVSEIKNKIKNLELFCKECPVNDITGRYFVQELKDRAEEITEILDKKEEAHENKDQVRNNLYNAIFVVAFTIGFNFIMALYRNWSDIVKLLSNHKP